MKRVLKKVNSRKKVYVIPFYLITLLYIVAYIYFIKNVLSLTGIENLYRFGSIVVFGLFLIFYIIFGIRNLINRSNKLFVLKTILAVIIIGFFALSGSIINYFFSQVGALQEKERVEYTTYLIKLKDKEFNSNSVIGLVNQDTDQINYEIASDIIKENNLQNKITNYDDYLAMVNDLYDNKINAIFVPSNFDSLFASEERFENISEEVDIVFQKTKLMDNADIGFTSTKDFTEPITILLMGVDSTIDGLNANAAFNGDTLMLITFNPHTLNTTMFSIPRDTYVPIACKNGNKSKINSSAAYGTNCVIDTVHNLTGIDIDYYVKINFKGIVDLVEALGGVEVDVEAPDSKKYNGQVCEQNSDRKFGSNIVCMNPGLQTLNGEQALAYARCRHLYLISDLARIKHQQEIVTAMGQKVSSLKNYNDFKNVIEAITKNISTNMSTEQMLSFYQVLKSIMQNSNKSGEFLTINKSYMEVYNLRVFLTSSNMYTSALGYYESSLKAIVKAMRVNLELEEPDPIKTFSFSVNEEYKIKAIGEGLRDNTTESTLPNFVGKTQGYVSSWCSSNGISCQFQEVDENSSNFNSSYSNGVVGAQSVHQGVLLSNVKSVTLYVNKKSNQAVTDNTNNTNTNTSANSNDNVDTKTKSTDENNSSGDNSNDSTNNQQGVENNSLLGP